MSRAPRRGGEFPDLQIVPVSDLLFHEEVDLERVARLIDRFSADGVLRNPPIAASFAEDGRFLLLDGANRVSALVHLEVQHALVQVEPFEETDLIVSHWNHVVRDIEAKTIADKASSLPGVEVIAGDPERAPSPAGRRHLCTVAFSENEALHLVGGGDLSEWVGALRAISRIYSHGPARMDRVSHADFETIRRLHPHFGAVVLFPSFTREEIREVAEAGERLPSGVTRFLVPRRVLGFNLQLALLRSQLPLADKRHWLAETIAARVADRRVRYYQEPTFVFDD